MIGTKPSLTLIELYSRRPKVTQLTPKVPNRVSEAPPDSEDLDGESAHRKPVDHIKWELNAEAFDKLLEHFSSDRSEAGEQYVKMKVKLERFFEWRSCASAEEKADKTMNRVARRICEGENIHNLPAYFFTVARLVFMESLRDREHTSVPFEEIPEIPAGVPFEDERKEARHRCLDRCLDLLPVESRSLILNYYHDERRAKIDHRKQLAEVRGIPLNALRIRAHRLRISLEKCVRECLAEAA